MHRLLSLLSCSRSPLCILAPVLLASSLLSACSSGGGGSQPSNLIGTDKDSICDRQWLLESLSVDGREHKSRMFWQKMWRDRPYLGCDKLGFVRGSAGSNPYLGKFQLKDGGSIRWLKPPQISRMSDRRDSSELEQDFMLALPRVDRARSTGDTLILEGRRGTRLQFKLTGELPTR